MNNLQLNWYAAYTIPKFEKKVHAELVKRHIEAYLPLQIVFRQWSDRIKKIEAPLFPNYIFIKTSDFHRHNAISAKGILRYVSFDGKPAKISDRDIDTMKKLENENPEVEPKLIEGTMVRIIRGPLAGFEGRLFSKRGKCRFGICIDAIKQSLSLEVPAAYIEEI